MLDHFSDNVYRPKLKGKARAMVVLDIGSAVRYFLAIRATLNDAGSPYKAVVAFTGKKLVDGLEPGAT